MEFLDLESFINNTNEYLAKYSVLNLEVAQEIINYLKEQLDKLSIKLIYEHLSCLDKINKIREEFKNNTAVFENIHIIQEIVPRFRLILSSLRHKANFAIPLVRNCNGLILAIEEKDLSNSTIVFCRILAVPPNEFNPHFRNDELIKMISKKYYQVYEIQDGTVINIYFDPYYISSENISIISKCISKYKDRDNEESHENKNAIKLINKTKYKLGKWTFSTKNAFDINNMIWRNHVYKTILEDTFKNYPDFSLEKLSKAKTYTIGFKHPAFHPFKQPAKWNENNSIDSWIKMCWFIQSIETTDFETINHTKSTCENIGLPFQKEININELDFKAVCGILNKSLENYLRNNENLYLGLILRSDKIQTGEYSDILLESTLWNEIRHMIYQIPYTVSKQNRYYNSQNFKNIDFVILNSYLDFRKKLIFISLFPQYKENYEKYDSLIENITDQIYKILKGCYNKGDTLVDYFIDIVKNQIQLTKNDKVDKQNIKDILLNPKFTDKFL